MASILERLSTRRVLVVDLSKDRKSIELYEACDTWFGVVLSKPEFGRLIDELKALHDQMIESED